MNKTTWVLVAIVVIALSAWFISHNNSTLPVNESSVQEKTSTYVDQKYNFSFSYPSDWRTNDNNQIGDGGSFQLVNYPEPSVSSEVFAKGQTKIEIDFLTDPASYYMSNFENKVELTVAQQKAYRISGNTDLGDYIAYVIEFPSKLGTYLTITLYGDQTNAVVQDKIVQSLNWH